MKKIILLMICAFSLIANAQSTKSNKMFNLLAKFTVKPQSVPEFMEASVHSLKESRKEAGNIEMKLFADKKKSNVFYVYSRWDNAVAYEFHKTLPHSKNIANVAKATLVKVPEIMPLGATLPATVRGAKQVNSEDQVETLFFIFKVKNGYRDRIIKRFETHVEKSRTEEGNLLFEFYTIEGDENTFVVYEKWRNPDAVWKVHMNQPYSKLTGSLINEALVGEMEQYLNFVTELEPNNLKPLSKNWKLKGFEMPESVVADSNSDWIYVSNIVNRTTPGYISRVSKNGKLDKLKWLEGLNQPCGLAIFDGKLYVGDQDKVHIIDIEKAQIIESLSVEGAQTLNDVAIDENGKVFVSDVMNGNIYTIENNKLIIWIENSNISHPNGLYVDGRYLIVANMAEEINQDASPKIPGSVYKIDIPSKSIELIKSSYQLGGLDGVAKVGEKYIITNNSGGELYAISDKERILLASLGKGIADLCADGQKVFIPNFAGTISSYTLKSEAKAKKLKGTFKVVDFGAVKLHVYQTNDHMTDYVFILEKEGKAVMLESPAFKDNFEELRTYMISNKINIEAIIPSYHPLGANFINTKELAGIDVYFTQHVLDYWKEGFGAVMKKGIPHVFGDKVDSSLCKPTVITKEGETEIAGIRMIFTESYDGFDIEIPEINTVYVHILGHNSHSEILGHEHLESSIANFKNYLNKGYTTYLSSHCAPETKANMETKLAYLKEMKKIVAKSHNENEFIDKMRAAYPNYSERYLKRTAEMFFTNKSKVHRH